MRTILFCPGLVRSALGSVAAALSFSLTQPIASSGRADTALFLTCRCLCPRLSGSFFGRAAQLWFWDKRFDLRTKNKSTACYHDCCQPPALDQVGNGLLRDISNPGCFGLRDPVLGSLRRFCGCFIQLLNVFFIELGVEPIIQADLACTAGHASVTSTDVPLTTITFYRKATIWLSLKVPATPFQTQPNQSELNPLGIAGLKRRYARKPLTVLESTMTKSSDRLAGIDRQDSV